ncbi:hypothetical protein [uncultured Selenomonas sp.]|uniref:hypothetical protein n=1 Tax=uncultured Selenomonas sp. TaxID=159275 RepID=UPI0025864BFB|nr:hypothetical protein [uncultured Selenomonas sp.]
MEMNRQRQAHREMADGCGCGHAHAPHTAEEWHRLARQRRTLEEMKAGAQRLQALHDKIDAALAQVTRENIGQLLTQKKTLRELKSEAAALFSRGLEHPMLRVMEQAEREYIGRIEQILHEAQLLKRAGRGSVTPEVLRNLAQGVAAAKRGDA